MERFQTDIEIISNSVFQIMFLIIISFFFFFNILITFSIFDYWHRRHKIETKTDCDVTNITHQSIGLQGQCPYIEVMISFDIIYKNTYIVLKNLTKFLLLFFYINYGHDI